MNMFAFFTFSLFHRDPFVHASYISICLSQECQYCLLTKKMYEPTNKTGLNYSHLSSYIITVKQVIVVGSFHLLQLQHVSIKSVLFVIMTSHYRIFAMFSGVLNKLSSDT